MIDVFYIFRGLVYAQSFLWLYLLDKDFEIENHFHKMLFYDSFVFLYLLLVITGFSFSQYTNVLLKFYVLLLLYSIVIIRFSNAPFTPTMECTIHYSFKDSICLGFLLVFINSYYWEFMLHFNAIILGGLSFNQIVQMFHLIPAYLLYDKLEIHDRKSFYKILIIGLIVSVLNLLCLNFLPNYIIVFNKSIFLRRIINYVTRFICMNILLHAVLSYSRVIKKGNYVQVFSR